LIRIADMLIEENDSSDSELTAYRVVLAAQERGCPRHCQYETDQHSRGGIGRYFYFAAVQWVVQDSAAETAALCLQPGLEDLIADLNTSVATLTITMLLKNVAG
jgi:hypothetical protein